MALLLTTAHAGQAGAQQAVYPPLVQAPAPVAAPPPPSRGLEPQSSLIILPPRAQQDPDRQTDQLADQPASQLGEAYPASLPSQRLEPQPSLIVLQPRAGQDQGQQLEPQSSLIVLPPRAKQDPGPPTGQAAGQSGEAYPPLALSADDKHAFGLDTQYGFQLGLAASNYRYSEPGFADVSGYKIGVEPAYTLPIGTSWFGRLDGRYANGRINYDSSFGPVDDITDWTYEIRATFGKDYILGDYSLSPYFGGGYRFLYNKLHVVGGYVRRSNYYYLPLGVTNRIRISPTLRLATTLEGDYLTSGQQESKLAACCAIPNSINQQNHGYGARGSIMLESKNWSFGPWFDLWHIHASGLSPVGFEPDNHTYELGGKVAYHF
jgi:hypothetical protein